MKPEMRSLTERTADALAERLNEVMSGDVFPGFPGDFDEHELARLGTPLRAYVVSFEGALTDCSVVLTHLPDDQADLVTQGMADAFDALTGGAARVAGNDRHELETLERADDQLEALYGEPSITFSMAAGDTIFIFGSSLLEELAAYLPASGDDATDGDVDASEHPHLRVVADDDASVHQGVAGAAAVHGYDAPLGITQAPTPEPAHGRWEQLLAGVQVTVSAELGSTQLRLGQLSTLNDDSVLTLDQLVDDPLVVYVNGAAYATGRLVVVDEEYGIEIVDILETAPAL